MKGKNRKKTKSLIALGLAVIMILGASMAYFSDRISVSENGEAGTLGITLDDTNINMLNSEGKDILDPGDMRNINFDVTNTGNKSADIRTTIKLTSSVPMDSSDAEYELYAANDVELVEGEGYKPKSGARPIQTRTLSADNRTITYNIPDYILNGNSSYGDNKREIEDGVTSDTHNYPYVLICKTSTGNTFQSSTVQMEILTEAKQHRNTNDWTTVATKTYTFQDGTIQVIVDENTSEENTTDEDDGNTQGQTDNTGNTPSSGNSDDNQNNPLINKVYIDKQKLWNSVQTVITQYYGESVYYDNAMDDYYQVRERMDTVGIDYNNMKLAEIYDELKSGNEKDSICSEKFMNLIDNCLANGNEYQNENWEGFRDYIDYMSHTGRNIDAMNYYFLGVNDKRLDELENMDGGIEIKDEESNLNESWSSAKVYYCKESHHGVENIDIYIIGTGTICTSGDASYLLGKENTSDDIRINDINLKNFSIDSNTDNISYMFGGMPSEKKLYNVNFSSWDTSNVTDMSGLFYDVDICENDLGTLTSLDLSTFNTSRVENMSFMFSGTGATSINVAAFNTYNVTDMSGMFKDCVNIEDLDVSHLNTRNVENMSEMFSRCLNLKTLNISNFNTSNVTSMADMFLMCKNLQVIDTSGFNTLEVKDMSKMFSNCETLERLHLDNFNTRNVTNMSGMFAGCNSLTELDLSSFDTSNVVNMSDMYENCSRLADLDLKTFDTSKVSSMSGMFEGCSNITRIDLTGWNTENCTSMREMFKNCTSIKDLDLSSFDTAKNRYAVSMFEKCQNIEHIYVSDKWNTSKVSVSQSRNMFTNCEKLPNYDSSVVDKTHADYSATGYLTYKAAN